MSLVRRLPALWSPHAGETLHGAILLARKETPTPRPPVRSPRLHLQDHLHLVSPTTVTCLAVSHPLLQWQTVVMLEHAKHLKPRFNERRSRRMMLFRASEASSCTRQIPNTYSWAAGNDADCCSIEVGEAKLQFRSCLPAHCHQHWEQCPKSEGPSSLSGSFWADRHRAPLTLQNGISIVYQAQNDLTIHVAQVCFSCPPRSRGISMQSGSPSTVQQKYDSEL